MCSTHDSSGHSCKVFTAISMDEQAVLCNAHRHRTVYRMEESHAHRDGVLGRPRHGHDVAKPLISIVHDDRSTRATTATGKFLVAEESFENPPVYKPRSKHGRHVAKSSTRASSLAIAIRKRNAAIAVGQHWDGIRRAASERPFHSCARGSEAPLLCRKKRG